MNKKLKKAQSEYNEILIPNQLNKIVNNTIKKVREEDKKMVFNKKIKGLIAASLLVVGSFTIGVNTSESFAQGVKNVPILSKFAKLVTYKSYEENKAEFKAEVNIPEVTGISTEDLEDKINKEIKNKMQMHLKEAKERAKEYKEAFLETGGNEDDFRPINIKVDYKIKSQVEDKLSFEVYYFESLASAYQKTYYYNIDLAKDKVLGLNDFFGENYEEIINKDIQKQIKSQQENEPAKYFEGEMGFNGIKEDQKFYINEDGNIVIVFDKYEIAPGSSGEPKFIIKNKKI